MSLLRRYFGVFTPHRILVSGYLLVTLIGAVLLSLPVASLNGRHQPFIDALFLATSGISTTGLTVVDIGSYYNTFGQVVLLCIFQIGSVGYMTFIVFLISILRIRLSLFTREVAKESLAVPDYRMLGRFFAVVVIFTAIFELAGGAVLTLFWARQFPLQKAAYLGIFHSISAFCTAGFSLFPDSLMKYKDSVVVNSTIIIVSVAGGLGFIVLNDLCQYYLKILKGTYPRRLVVHTKIVLTVSFAVMLTGTLIILNSEYWPSGIGLGSKIWESAFQAISASTTDGYNTLDIGSMSAVSLTCLMILMFVGASPGGTGGGVKTSTLGLILTFLWLQLKGKENHINIFKRKIPVNTIHKSFGIVCWFVIIATAGMLLLSSTEKATYLQILFETISALGNTGLSTGITSNLTNIGKAVLIIIMFLGRVGPLTAGLSLVGKQKPAFYEYAREDIFVG